MPRASLAFLCAAAALACEVPETDGRDLGPVDRAVETEYSVCHDDRYIAKLADPDKPCADVGGWSGGRLFREGTEWLQANADSIPTAMKRFCIYDWEGTGDPKPGPLLERFGENAVQDCDFVVPQGDKGADVITEALSPKLEEMFLAATHHVPAEDLAATEDSRQPVFIAVLDTQPFPNPDNPRSEHGDSVARIVRKFACPGGDAGCPVQVETVLALPRTQEGDDYVRGGYRGTLMQLAAATHEAVLRWQQANVGSKVPSRLVMVQAVGWERGDPMADQGPANDAMQIVMREAACHGAIVVASAGNQTTSCDEGPFDPGGVEQHALPTAAACDALDIIGPPKPLTSYAPIVYSAGALDLSGEKLESAREGGFPRLVAPGSHAVIDTDTSDPTMLLTGTSVPAAAVAGMAGLAWSYAHGLTGAQVMQAIYDAGDELGPGVFADYALSGQPAQAIHKAYACESLVQACSIPDACTDAPALSCGGYPKPNVAELEAIIAALPVGHEAAPDFERKDVCSAHCGPADRQLYVSVDGSAATCDDHRVDPYDLVVRPTPDLMLCPSCTHTVESAEVKGSLSKKYQGSEVEEVIIDTVYTDGEEDTHVFGQVTMTPYTVTRFVLEGARTDIGVAKSTITITLTDGTVSTEPMLGAE